MGATAINRTRRSAPLNRLFIRRIPDELDDVFYDGPNDCDGNIQNNQFDGQQFRGTNKADAGQQKY
jgi:hypothetical protein